jgi:hypothetical protein
MTSTTTSASATLLDLAVANQADRVAAFARRTGRPLLADDDLVVAWMADRGVFFNQAYILGTPDGAAEWAAIAERIAAVVPSPAPVMVISPYVSADPLGELGFAHIGEPPLMVRPAGPDHGPTPPPGLEVREVVDEVGLEVFERTVVDGYPCPDVQPYRWGGYLSGAVLGGATRFWLGLVDGRPVATAWSHTAHGVNAVEAVATLAAARGAGYGYAVTWAATTADPTLPAVLYASDLGRPVYERLGYETIKRWSLWLRP